MRDMPDDVQDSFGHAIWLAQIGRKAVSAKPLKGYHGAGVLEIVEDWDADTYRAVYTVRYAGVVYVLHVFQKKSTHGIATSERDLGIVRNRLRWAEEHYLREVLGRER